MKTQVFVLVACDLPPVDIQDAYRRLLEPHRFDPDEPDSYGRFDYLVGALNASFNDTSAEEQLPPNVRDALAGNICLQEHLPANLVPGALVTPDGQWHDLSDFGWKLLQGNSGSNRAALARWESRYRELIDSHPHCWVVEAWTHS